MPYTFTTPDEQRQMLETIGVDKIEDLFASIPADMRLRGLLDLPPALDELELDQWFDQLASRNDHARRKTCFLGGGSYDHFIPAAVDTLASRGEFYTSYTPYQAEVSQGNLQVMFEYQTLICQLTGMDVSNASLYDGGSAAVEAVLMSRATTRRHGKVVILESVHPEYRRIIETYMVNLNTQVQIVPTPTGVADPAQVAAALDDETACVVVGHPNFFGALEPIESIVAAAQQRGVVVIQTFDPISLGLLKPPGQLGVDIAVAEGQSLGSPMAYGGPYLGILTCRESFIRRMPGRIAGQTISANDRRCWVLTLQTREQHIRREKATSNICTNQGLYALRASIYLALLGPAGLGEVAELCLRKAHYAVDRIADSDRFELAFDAPFFKEFVVRDRAGQVAALLAAAEHHGIMAGIPLGRWYPQWDDCFLVSVTERRSKAEIDRLARVLSAAARPAEAARA